MLKIENHGRREGTIKQWDVSRAAYKFLLSKKTKTIQYKIRTTNELKPAIWSTFYYGFSSFMDKLQVLQYHKTINIFVSAYQNVDKSYIQLRY